MINFACKLNRLLNTPAVTVLELAEEYEVSETTITRWCSGLSEPHDLVGKSVLEYLEVKLFARDFSKDLEELLIYQDITDSVFDLIHLKSQYELLFPGCKCRLENSQTEYYNEYYFVVDANVSNNFWVEHYEQAISLWEDSEVELSLGFSFD